MFKKVESPKCTFCQQCNETPLHFFIECKKTCQFYEECQKWLASANIILPTQTVENIFLGSSISVFHYFLLLVWKYTLYSSRMKSKPPCLNDFKSQVIMHEKIEYHISEKKAKLITHLNKYEALRSILP